jgi:hypothetical protein
MNSDCTAQKPVCNANACVQCVANSDCSAAAPVCSKNACVGCAVDADCASGACADNSTCVDAANLIYVNPTGSDTGACPQAAPCATIQYAISQGTSSRSQIVLAKATYTERLTLSSTVTAAPMIRFFGGGATLMLPATGENNLLMATNVGFDIRNVTMIGTSFAAAMIQAGTAPSSVQDVQFQNAVAGILVAGGNVTVKNVQMSNVVTGVQVLEGGTLNLDRAIIHGGQNALEVKTPGDGNINVSNMLVYDATGPVEVAGALGKLSFSTIGSTSTSVAALDCGPGVTLSSAIVWNTTSTAISGTCDTIQTTIAGPTTVAGATNADPLFKNLLQSDYHLSATSPAIDQVGAGPALDFEGDARPQGAAFDIGADEYKP